MVFRAIFFSVILVSLLLTQGVLSSQQRHYPETAIEKRFPGLSTGYIKRYFMHRNWRNIIIEMRKSRAYASALADRMDESVCHEATIIAIHAMQDKGCQFLRSLKMGEALTHKGKTTIDSITTGDLAYELGPGYSEYEISCHCRWEGLNSSHIDGVRRVCDTEIVADCPSEN